LLVTDKQRAALFFGCPSLRAHILFFEGLWLTDTGHRNQTCHAWKDINKNHQRLIRRGTSTVAACTRVWNFRISLMFWETRILEEPEFFRNILIRLSLAVSRRDGNNTLYFVIDLSRWDRDVKYRSGTSLVFTKSEEDSSLHSHCCTLNFARQVC
jgi:hypothetical protein